uniref:Fibronectin type-III domain-containing protein n=1 Tax=Meloidogyne incognita TaxID=6306 RepID=A0A914KKQ6_MELIC
MSTKKCFIILFVLIVGIVEGKKKKTTQKVPLVKANINTNTNNKNDNTGLTPFCNCASVTPNFGSNTDIPQNPCVPTLAYDQKSIWITWNRPDNTNKGLLDYNVYMNGNKIGSSSENANNYSISAPYINNFHNVDKNKFHVPTLFNSFYVDNLEANTLYKFTIRAVYSDGESEDSVTLTAKTAQNYGKIIDITEKGANGDGKTINTDAIQGAIYDCGQTSSAFDCKVLVPEGTFISGALFIQAPLTLELAEGAIIQGSGESSDFPKNKGRSGKPPSLLNVVS